MTGTKGTRGGGNGIVIQDRDRELLWQLFIMHVADRNQLIVAAGFTSLTRINTRLLALYRTGLIRRFFIGFGGAQKALYALSQKGAQLIGVPLRGPRRRQDALLAADFSVLHQLAINDVYCTVRFGPIPIPHVGWVNWMGFTEPIAENVRLIPDGYVEFHTPAGIDAAFLEVDLGNESMDTWREKAKRYLDLARSGDYARTFKQPRFRVLVLADAVRRLRFIRTAVADVTEKIFWFATLEDTRGEKFFDPVWLRPKGAHHQPLFEQSR